MQQVIQTDQLSKSYKDFQAVKSISLSINKGEIYGFIGLNGAGKTTMIRMLLGMIKPTRGTCYINGEKVTSTNHRIWKGVGHIVETPHSYPELTVEENLEIFRQLRRMLDPHAVSTVMDQLHVTRYARTKAGNLSVGNAQRLGIAKALLHSPDILILDEPVNGLDPAGILEIRELLQDLVVNQGVIKLISRHLLNEIAKIATKIGIIHEGELIQEIESNKVNELLHRRLNINTRDNMSAISKLTAAGYPSTLNTNGYIEINHKKAIQHPDEVSRLLVSEGFPPTQLTVEEENLESYFLRIIDGKGENM